jgi:amino acid adenylation domain-containing protein
LAFDLFSCAMRHCLEFPASRLLLDDVPEGLAERLAHVELQPPQSALTTHVSEHSAEEWSEVESSIRAVLAKLSSSDTERIRRHTTIYQLGLDSISAVRIAAMLRDHGYHVAASDVIDNPTCQSLGQLIAARAPGLEDESAFDLAGFQSQVLPQVIAQGVPADDIELILPCTPLQCAMVAQFVKSGGLDYFNYVQFELDNDLDTSNLIRAWESLSLTHPILRTAVIPIEHDDIAFAMIQYRLPELAAVELTDEIDPELWRLRVAHSAVSEPWKGLWKVAVVGSKMHLAIHHALYDAHSLQLLLKDLAKALADDMTSPPSRTEDVVVDILGQVSAKMDSSAQFWKQQAQDVVINSFPVMTPLRQATRDVLAEVTTSSLPLTTLEEAAARAGYPLQVILQAAWTRVLSGYLGESKMIFGVALSGRSTETTRNAVFPCVTTLPVISSNSDSNCTLLTQMLKYNTELFGQQHQSLTHIQKWLGCPDVRLFDTLLVYQKLDIAPAERSPWRIIEEKANIDYPVSIEIEPTQGDRLRYQITFFSDVLPKQQATILLKQFDAAIHHLVLEPNGQEPNLFALRPDLFSILPPEMREIPTTVKSLHHFVELQALSTPNATALHFVERFDNGVPVGRTWTYAELDANGNRVAQMLHPHVNRGDIVAVYFDKCPAAYFSILGILKSGCAFVALDPAAPRSRNELIIMDSGVSVLLTALDEKGQLWKPLTSAVLVLTIDEDSLLAVPADPQISNRDVQPDDVCYCLYTSGTTGTPKGCLITHDNAVQCMLAFQRIFQGHWQEDSKWLQFASLHFDVSVLEQYWSWSVGITLVAAPRDLILEDLAAAISRLGITHIDLTPSLARLLHPDDVPSLCKGVFITGGESLKQEILDVWGSKAVIYNFYGPTEATIGVTVYPRVPTSGRASNIGRQFVNVGSYVLKRGTEQPVLRGGVGELCVSGRLVGKGYLKREGLTAEKFPTLQHFGDRVYRTGDLVRVLHDGCFDFLGRADDQVKLRGQRLEIGEINHTIRKGVETVTDVATLVVRDEVNAKDLLVSFVVGANTARTLAGPLRIIESPDALDLCRRARDTCRSKLPAYMVPTYVLQMSYIPLSANNKTDIKTLGTFVSWLSPEKLVSLSCSTEQARRTLSLTEGKIAKALAGMQSLDMSLILPNSSIFELGIDSISVLRFCRALRKEGLVQATPSLVLRHPLLCDLAGALEVPKRSSNSESIAAARQLVQACAHKHRSHVCGELGVTPDQIEYIAPCSPLQQGMISRAEIDGAYFNTFRFQLAREVSPQLLRQAWQKTVDALPILRTKFVRTVDGLVQVALKELVMQWRERQIQVCGESAVEDAIVESRESWIAKNQGSLVQPLEAVLVYVGCTGQRLLLLHIFHGLYDANSLLLVLDRVAREYQSLAGGYLGKTPASGPSFFDALLHGPLQDFSSSRSFWVKHFDGVTFSKAITTSVSTSTISAHQDVSLRRLEPLRKGLGVTHQAIIQAAWVSVLAKHLAANPTIGIIFSGRTIELEGIEEVVGPLFNTLPFQARLSTENGTFGTTWASLIRQCHDFNTAVLAFPHVPLRDIQKWCSRGQAMFNTLFSFHRSDAAVAVEQELWTTVDSEPSADYPLALEATLSSDDCMRLLLVAQSAAYSQDKLSDFMDGLQWAFDAMAENADQIITPNEQGPIGNGHGNDARNGLDDLVDDTPQTFAWTEEASLLRDEVAKLANIAPETVTEATPLFGLGLDSIDVIKLSARLKRHGIRIKTSELMKAQSIAAALQLLKRRGDDAQHNGSTTSLSVGSEARSRLREYLAGLGELGDGDIALPATPLQESMMAGMIESDFRLYFNHDIREIAPSVNIGRLKAAWNTVIAGSPILRTIFLPVDSPDFEFTYCQVIRRESSPRISDVGLDFRDQLAMVCDAATQRALEGAGRFNLLQITFASIGEQKFLVLSIAHALYDGWSLGLLHQDVQRAYEGSYSPGDMEDYVSQLDTLLFRGHQDASSFWSGFLRDSNPTLFPWSQETPEQEGTAHRVELASSLPSTKIASFCKSQAVTLQTLGQACWAALLAARTGALDVIFGVVLSGRDSEALEDLVFPTMNTVAIRSVLHGTVSSWVRYMQDNVASILPHQHFPLREAQKLAQTKGPLFNTLFIHQREVDSPSRREWEQLLKSVDGSSAVEYPVCVEMASSSGGQLTWRAAINATCGTHDDSVRLLKDLDSVLAYLVRSPDAEVLVFGNTEVSICGLGPTALGVKDDTSTTTPSGPSTGESDVSWSPIEKKIRDVLSEVSGFPVASILRRHNIYHLGLDSISAIKAGSLLRKKGIDVGFRDVLKSRSIADMAQIVSATGSEAPLSSNESDCPNPNPAAWDADIDVASAFSDAGVNESVVQEVLPATPMQVHMLSVWQNTNGEIFYPLFTFILRGRVDKAAITAAWEALVAETPILRTVFISTGSRLIPILQAIIQPSVVHQGWSSASPGIWGSDTAPGGLVQPYHHFHAEECGPETWKIQLRIHHALYDAVSLMTLMHRFSALCTTTEQPANPKSDWREAVRECASEKRRASRKKFWTQRLARVVPTPLSSFGQEQKEYEGSSSRIRVVRKAALNAVEVSKLKGRCKFQGISLQSLFFAAYAEVLASYAQGVRPERVMFGVYMASHDSWWPRVKNSRTSYPQLRLVPLRVVLEDRSLLDVARMILNDIHTFSLAKQAEVGVWEIMDWTGLKVDSFVNFLSLPARDEDDADGVKIELEPSMVADGEAGSQEGREASEEYRIPRELANNAVRDAYAVSGFKLAYTRCSSSLTG